MIEIIYSPKWFYGKDIVIDIIAVLVLFLIGFFSIKYYNLDKKNKNYLFLALSFFMISLSFLAKILTNFTIYYHVLETKQLGLVRFTYQTIQSTDTLFFFAYLSYRILTLVGLYILYSLYHKKQPKSNIFLIIYLLLAFTYFSQSTYYIFHLTSLLLLTIITYQYYKNYIKKKMLTAKLLVYSFAIIAISQISFIFIRLNQVFYAIAEVIQLIGYILLLITFILVLKHGKTK